MSQELPYGDFQFLSGVDQLNCVDLDETSNNVLNFIVSRPNGIGHALQCDIVYPAELRDEHSDLPFLPEMKEPTAEMLSEAQKGLHTEAYGGESASQARSLSRI